MTTASVTIVNCMGGPVWYLGGVTGAEIVEQIRKLPPDERREVIEQLRDEFAEFDDELSRDEAEFTDRRRREHREKPDDVVTWEQVKATISKKFGCE